MKPSVAAFLLGVFVAYKAVPVLVHLTYISLIILSFFAGRIF